MSETSQSPYVEPRILILEDVDAATGMNMGSNQAEQSAERSYTSSIGLSPDDINAVAKRAKNQKSHSRRSSGSSFLGVPGDEVTHEARGYRLIMRQPAGYRYCSVRGCNESRDVKDTEFWAGVFGISTREGLADFQLDKAPPFPKDVQEWSFFLGKDKRPLPFCPEHASTLRKVIDQVEQKYTVLDIIDLFALATEKRGDEPVKVLNLDEIMQDPKFTLNPFNYCWGTGRTTCGGRLLPGTSVCRPHWSQRTSEPGRTLPDCRAGTANGHCVTLVSIPGASPDILTFKQEQTIKPMTHIRTGHCDSCEAYLVSHSLCVTCAKSTRPYAWGSTNHYCLSCYEKSPSHNYMKGNSWLDTLTAHPDTTARFGKPGGVEGIYTGAPFFRFQKPLDPTNASTLLEQRKESQLRAVRGYTTETGKKEEAYTEVPEGLDDIDEAYPAIMVDFIPASKYSET